MVDQGLERRERRIARWKARAAARRQRIAERLSRPTYRPAARERFLEVVRTRLAARRQWLAAALEHVNAEIALLNKKSASGGKTAKRAAAGAK